MVDLTLTENKGSLYLNNKLMVTKMEVEKYGMPAVELSLLRRIDNLEDALGLLRKARELLSKTPVELKGVSFLKDSSLLETKKPMYLHHTLPLEDGKKDRHTLDLVKFGETIYGIFVDGKIVATNGMADEPKALVREILALAGKKLGEDEVDRLNSLLAKVASLKSSRDYIVLTVAQNNRKKKLVG